MNKTREEYNAYMRTYLLDRYHKRREEAINLLGGQCSSCGRKDDLEFHHIDPSTKSFTIAKMWSVSLERFREEIKKCKLLCGPCHRKNHKPDHPHGTALRYWRGCRCKPCRLAKSNYHKEYMRERRSVADR